MIFTQPKRKIIVGVTGRAYAGKTSFARKLARNGAELVEADKIAWELYKIPEVKKAVIETFGKKIFDSRGGLDRKKLGGIVFENPKALQKLNEIVHPPLTQELERRIESAAQDVVIIDAALLLDWPLAERCDLLIAVVADEAMLTERAAAEGVDTERLSIILKVQRPEEEFRRRCHIVVENDATIEDLGRKAQEVWQAFILPLC